MPFLHCSYRTSPAIGIGALYSPAVRYPCCSGKIRCKNLQAVRRSLRPLNDGINYCVVYSTWQVTLADTIRIYCNSTTVSNSDATTCEPKCAAAAHYDREDILYGTQEAMSNKVIQELEADIEHYRNAIQDEPSALPEDVKAWRHELSIAREKLIHAKKMAVQ